MAPRRSRSVHVFPATILFVLSSLTTSGAPVSTAFRIGGGVATATSLPRRRWHVVASQPCSRGYADHVLAHRPPSSASLCFCSNAYTNTATSRSATTSTSLHAKKSAKKSAKKKAAGGGGFGTAKSSSSSSSATSVTTISADKDALEKQWDCFASITDLEIRPVLDEEDPNYRKFEVADVFVRVGPGGDGSSAGSDQGSAPATGWYRVGKVVAADDIVIEASLSLQRGLIFWTAAHMWPELVAKGGKKGAQLLELGHTGATMYMASDSDPPLDEEESEEVQIVQRASSDLIQGVSPKNIGYRPDFNPPGFTYKRREKSAMKKKKSNMEEILAVGDE